MALSPEELLHHIQGIDRSLCQRIEKLEAAAAATATLREVLVWCITDAANEDGYPTQEMFDNRIEVIRNALTGEVSDE